MHYEGNASQQRGNGVGKGYAPFWVVWKADGFVNALPCSPPFVHQNSCCSRLGSTSIHERLEPFIVEGMRQTHGEDRPSMASRGEDYVELPPPKCY